VDYNYRADVLAQLARHGVYPTPATPPQLVYDFVNDLYRYELRRLRDQLVRGAIPKAGYYDRVVALRVKYPLVSIKPELWIDQA
jgi:hypothetical protein